MMTDASIKPRSDISDILQKKHGFKPLGVPLFGKLSKKQINEMARGNTKRLVSGDLVFWQYPNYTNQPAYLEKVFISNIHKHHAKVIAILHDMDFLRGWQDSVAESLKYFDGFISTSKALTDILKSWGIDVPIVEMGPFTYLTQVHKPTYFSRQVYYCGSLYNWKSSFLKTINFPLIVYSSFKSDLPISKNIHLMGSVASKELENRLNSGFGLIWDESVNKKAHLKPYLAYNWPYKLSLYIACGLPVICQKDTNVGNYVEKYHIGYTVASLKEVPAILAKATPVGYGEMLRNIEELRGGVTEGNNVWLGVRKAIKQISNSVSVPTDVKVVSKSGIISVYAD